MTLPASTLGMLALAGLLLVCSAHCFGLPARWLRRLALALSLSVALPAVALAQTGSGEAGTTARLPGAGSPPPTR